METLKAISEINLPDSRQAMFKTLIPDDAGLRFRDKTIEDHYLKVSSVCLHESVPEEIKSHFATALNLIIYSWFYYPFNVTAQFMAYVSVEHALRFYYGHNKKTPFKALLARAVKEGLIHERGFSHQPGERKSEPALSVDFPTSDSDNYANTLVESLPFLRNELAHGSSTLHPHGHVAVRICAELINQLFTNTTNVSA